MKFYPVYQPGAQRINDLYEFPAGSALWAVFTIFIVGLVVRFVYLYGLSKEWDRVFHNHVDPKSGYRSITHRFMPLGSTGFRAQPVFGMAFFLFHAGLPGIPLFLPAHNTLWHQAFGISLPSLPVSISDALMP